MRVAIALLLLMAAAEVHAVEIGGRDFEILPLTPTEITPLSVRVTIEGCDLLPQGIDVVREGSVIALEFETIDFCVPAQVVPERTYPMGVFPAGQYSVEYRQCGFLNNGEPCQTLGSFPLSVGSYSGRAATIPALGWIGMLSLIAFVGLLGMRIRARA